MARSERERYVFILMVTVIIYIIIIIKYYFRNIFHLSFLEQAERARPIKSRTHTQNNSCVDDDDWQWREWKRKRNERAMFISNEMLNNSNNNSVFRKWYYVFGKYFCTANHHRLHSPALIQNKLYRTMKKSCALLECCCRSTEWNRWPIYSVWYWQMVDERLPIIAFLYLSKFVSWTLQVRRLRLRLSMSIYCAKGKMVVLNDNTHDNIEF